jgi:predicted Rossmann fold nucleotide-binding protein DprA/Smf involved in DNA uptake
VERDDLRVIVALTARLASGEKGLAPLTPTEWDTAAQAIYQHGAWPRDLLGVGAPDLLEAISTAGKRLTTERLGTLLGRMSHVDQRIRDWESHGITLIPRGGSQYPRPFRLHLKASCPPLLWGTGNLDLLSQNGVAIVGSRDAEYEALRRASDLGAAVAQTGFVTISGGARGIDERAVEGALMAGGSAVVILPDSLAVQTKKIQFKRFLKGGQLALISPYSPDAGYQTGTAMGRNRLIYCLAEAAFVVRSSRHAGGTFAGAQQALDNAWTQIWVERSDDPESGNAVLRERYNLPVIPSDDLTEVWDSIREPVTVGTRSIAEAPAQWTPFE